MVNAYETSPAEAKIVVEVSKDISGKDNPYKILRYVREFYCGRNTQIDDLIEELVDAYKQMSKHSF
jgi:sulfur relay (sulfurtransferase) DsrC/TusE family protein